MNKIVLHVFLYLFSLTSLLLCLGGCIPFNTNGGKALSSASENSIDSSCAYFYFMWGTHAEYDQRIEEALEAYEKAAICDNTADYIIEKVPILLIRLDKKLEASTWLKNYLAEHPGKNSQRFLLARLYIQDDKIKEATQLYEEALFIDADNRNIQLRLALLYGQQKKYKKAETILQKLLNGDPNLYYAALYLARLSAQTENHELAAKNYAQALSINWSEELIYEMVEYFNFQKEYTKSLALYEQILDKSPMDERAGLGRIQSLLYLDKIDEALSKLSDIRKITDSPDKIDLIISQIYINNDEYEVAEPLLFTLSQKKDTPEIHYLLAIVYFELSKFEEAIATLKHIQPDSEEYEYSIYLQVKIFSGLEQYEKARVLLEDCILRDQTIKPVYFNYLASVYKESNNYASAIKTLEDGVALFPEDERLHFEYGLLLETTGNVEEALSAMKKVIELQPNHAEALNFIGYTWANSNQNLDQALQYIQQAVLMRPESGYIRDSLGWVYFRLGDFEQARIELENAISLEPSDPHIYDHLGDTYRAMTNREKALEKYKKALEMFKEEEKKKLIQDKIDALSES